jgi:transposase
MFSGMEVRDLEKMIKKLPMKFTFLTVPTPQTFEEQGQDVPSGLITGLEDRLTFELGHAERQVPGLRRLLDAWMKKGQVQAALEVPEKQEKAEVKTSKKNKWILPVMDLRKGGGGTRK